MVSRHTNPAAPSTNTTTWSLRVVQTMATRVTRWRAATVARFSMAERHRLAAQQ
jgi:hypothetical protein